MTEGMDNIVTMGGVRVNVGPTPFCIRDCGFADRVAVEAAAQRFGRLVRTMDMRDVAAYFDARYLQEAEAAAEAAKGGAV